MLPPEVYLWVYHLFQFGFDVIFHLSEKLGTCFFGDSVSTYYNQTNCELSQAPCSSNSRIAMSALFMKMLASSANVMTSNFEGMEFKSFKKKIGTEGDLKLIPGGRHILCFCVKIVSHSLLPPGSCLANSL